MLLFLCAITLLISQFAIPSSGRSMQDEHIHRNKVKDPYKVYKIYPNSTAQLNALKDIWISATKYEINFWKDPSRVGAAVDIMVPAHMQPQMENIFHTDGLEYTIMIEDVKQLMLERERVHDKQRVFMDDSSAQKVYFDFTRYHDYEEMRVYMRAVEKQYPNIARVYNLGFTHENKPIEMIKIGSPLYSTSKKGIWVDAGIHAREWASHSTAIYFIHQLVTKYEQDPFVTQLVQNLTWYITPVVNPDGYMYTRSSRDPEVRMWRKNRSPNKDQCRDNKVCCKGVDLNRNFDFHWGESGASTNPCDEVYQGSAAFSEPEAQAVRDFLWAHQNEIEAVITMHTYSQLWLHPFGHERGVYPTDIQELKDTANIATRELEKLYGTQYRVGSGADALYPAAGGSDDWSKSKAGIKYVYLLELRPEENVYDGFILDTSQLIPTGRETWAGVKMVAKTVLERNKFTVTSDVNAGIVSTTPLEVSSTTTTITTTTTTTPTTTATTPIIPETPTPTITETSSTSTTSSTTEIISSTTTSMQTSSTTLAPTTSPSTTTTSITTATVSTTESTTSTSTTATASTTESTTSTSTTVTTTLSPSTSSPIVTEAPPTTTIVSANPNCVDKASEKRCARWVFHRVGICQRIVEYMSDNCAKTCGFC